MASVEDEALGNEPNFLGLWRELHQGELLEVVFDFAVFE